MSTVRASNSAYLRLLDPTPVTGTGWEIHFVSDIDAATVWAITANFTDAMYSDALNDVGGFSLTMWADDPLWTRPLPGGTPGTVLDREVIVRFVQDGQTRFEGLLEDIAPQEVAEGIPTIVLTGRGLPTVLERVIMLPADLDDPFAFLSFERTSSGPGMSAWLYYLAEAQWRGGALLISTDFTHDTDSMGIPWLRSADRSITGGTDLLSILQQVCDAEGLQWRFDYRTRTLSVADELGQHREDEIVFFVGRHIQAAERQITRRSIATDVYVRATKSGIVHSSAGNAAARSMWGRRERWLNSDTATNAPACALLAAAELALNANERTSQTATFGNDTMTLQPGRDYTVGDFVAMSTPLATSVIRVVAISTHVDANGTATTDVTLQSRFEVEEVRTRKALQRLGDLATSIRLR